MQIILTGSEHKPHGHFGPKPLCFVGRTDVWVDFLCNWRVHMAAYNDNVAQVSFYIAHGADVNARDRTGKTPLHRASQGNAKATAKMLLDFGANPDAKDQGGATPLHYAAWEGALTVAALLVAHGGDVSAKDKNGKTPLQYADGPLMEELLRADQ